MGFLNISGNSIGDTGKQVLGDMLMKHPISTLKTFNCSEWSVDENTTTLNLSGMKRVDRGFNQNDMLLLAGVLISAKTPLEELYVGFNGLQDTGVQTLVDLLKWDGCKITKLGLQGSDDYRMGPSGIKILADGIRNANTALSYLNLFECRIGTKGMKLLADSLREAKTPLVHLNLAFNDIGQVGMQHLALALQEAMTALAFLDISYNGLQAEGIQVLSNLLKWEGCKITRLELRGNRMGPQEMEVLADGIRNASTPLEYLNLEYTFGI